MRRLPLTIAMGILQSISIDYIGKLDLRIIRIIQAKQDTSGDDWNSLFPSFLIV